MNKIITSLIVGIVLVMTFVIALPTLPPPIPNGFTLTMPNLPSATGQNLRVICGYIPTEIYVNNVKVNNNYVDGINFRVEYSLVINEKQCAAGFAGNVSYTQLQNPVTIINQDFSNQLLGSIVIPSSEPSPVATGNNIPPNPNAGGVTP